MQREQISSKKKGGTRDLKNVKKVGEDVYEA